MGAPQERPLICGKHPFSKKQAHIKELINPCNLVMDSFHPERDEKYVVLLLPGPDAQPKATTSSHPKPFLIALDLP